MDSPSHTTASSVIPHTNAIASAATDEFSHMTVEGWLRSHLDRLVKSGEDAVDDAVADGDCAHEGGASKASNTAKARRGGMAGGVGGRARREREGLLLSSLRAERA